MTWRETNESWFTYKTRGLCLMIARWLDSWRPDWCWTAAVMRTYGYKEWDVRKQLCTQESGAYCGKCYITGRLREAELNDEN